MYKGEYIELWFYLDSLIKVSIIFVYLNSMYYLYVNMPHCLFKVWDILDHNCLLTVRPKGHKIRGDLQACHYSSAAKSIAIATDQMAILNLKLKWVLGILPPKMRRLKYKMIIKLFIFT